MTGGNRHVAAGIERGVWEAMMEQDAAAVSWQASPRSRFELTAPRHFLLPAILLLLVEEPQHGYGLAKGLQELKFGRVDRPSVYRALAQLEGDGLIDSSQQESQPGQGRHVYCLTQLGEQVLRGWMGVIKQERDGLDRVLRRYVATGTVDALLAEVEGRWHSLTASPWSPVSSTFQDERGGGSRFSGLATDVPDVPDSFDDGLDKAEDECVSTSRFRVVPDRSVVLIDARSSVGPITFGAMGVTGVIEASVSGRRVSDLPRPGARLQLDVEQLQSGNSLYDAELLRRIDARRHPTVTVDLRACTALGCNGRYRLVGEMTFNGVSKPLDGTVAVEMTSDRKMVVLGEQVIDIRDFGVSSPTVLMLRIYPDVVVRLQVEAELEDPDKRQGNHDVSY